MKMLWVPDLQNYISIIQDFWEFLKQFLVLTPLGGHFFWTLVPRAISDLGNLALRFLGLFRIAGLPVLDTPRPY